MPTPRRRNHPATGAFFFALAALALALSLGGCSSLPVIGKKKAAPRPEPLIVAPRHIEIGRILRYNADDATAVIEFVPHFRAARSLDGARLIARKPDTLEPTARLVAAPYQNNRALGAYVASGRPGPDDEVVLDPDPAPAGASSKP